MYLSQVFNPLNPLNILTQTFSPKAQNSLHLSQLLSSNTRSHHFQIC